MQLLRLTLFDFAVVFFASGAVLIGPITSAALWRSTLPNAIARRWLALLILAVTAYLLTEIIRFGDFFSLTPWFYYSPLRFTFSFGPLFFFYIRQLLVPTYRWRSIDWLHWILPIAQIVLVVGVGFQSVAVKYIFWQQVDIPWYQFFDTGWTSISMIGYGIAAWVYLKAAEQSAKKIFASHAIAVFLTCGSVAFVIDTILINVLGLTLYLNPLWISLPVIAYSAGLVYIAVRGVQFHSVPIKERQETYGINKEKLTALSRQLEQLMRAEKPYLDPDLTLRTLAQQMGLPSKQMSYIINETAGKSYHDFVNQYRLEAVCKLLHDDSLQDQSILEIAMQAGFSSKSTFNRLFREHIGTTPSDYRKSYRKT